MAEPRTLSPIIAETIDEVVKRLDEVLLDWSTYEEWHELPSGSTTPEVVADSRLWFDGIVLSDHSNRALMNSWVVHKEGEEPISFSMRTVPMIDRHIYVLGNMGNPAVDVKVKIEYKPPRQLP